jgi:hypothetical protein
MHFVIAVAEPLADEEATRNLIEGALYPVLTKGLTELCKEKPANPTVRFLLTTVVWCLLRAVRHDAHTFVSGMVRELAAR